jgi:hypothetical protein
VAEAPAAGSRVKPSALRPVLHDGAPTARAVSARGR